MNVFKDEIVDLLVGPHEMGLPTSHIPPDSAVHKLEIGTFSTLKRKFDEVDQEVCKADEVRKANEVEEARKTREVEEARKAREDEEVRKAREDEEARKAREAEEDQKEFYGISRADWKILAQLLED